MKNNILDLQQSGFILYVNKYKDCVYFYEKVLELKVLYRKETLTCFDFYGSYLIVELDDELEQTERLIPSRDRTCLRINVSNVRKACALLDKHDVQYIYQELAWGTIAKFRDPDGNLIGFRSVKEHKEDIEKG